MLYHYGGLLEESNSAEEFTKIVSPDVFQEWCDTVTGYSVDDVDEFPGLKQLIGDYTVTDLSFNGYTMDSGFAAVFSISLDRDTDGYSTLVYLRWQMDNVSAILTDNKIDSWTN